jgi:alpha-mannosidase
MRQNLESNDTALLAFGNGDGGGGPLAKMLENVSRNFGVVLPKIDECYVHCK